MEVKETESIDLSDYSNPKKKKISSPNNQPKKKDRKIYILGLIILVLIAWFFITLGSKSKGSFIPDHGVTNIPGEPPRLETPLKP
jgi:hypothetical protein